jgi:hypothetical protein
MTKDAAQRRSWTFYEAVIFDNTMERKGKPVEKRGRKATGLKLESQDSRAVEFL